MMNSQCIAQRPAGLQAGGLPALSAKYGRQSDIDQPWF